MRIQGQRTRRGVVKRTVVAVLAIAAIAVGGMMYMNRDTDDTGVDLDTAARTTVEKGELVVSLLQAGELSAKDSKSITNETRTTCKIVEVVDDGAKVKKGDLLVELDVSELRDKLMTTEASVSQAEASLEEAEEDLEIKELQYKTDLRSTQLKVELAKLDLKKFQEAAHPLAVKEAQSALTLAKEELARSIEKRDSIKRLVEKGFTNPQDLESAELEVTRRELDVDNKETKLSILKNYTHTEQLKQKQNDVEKASTEVDRLKKTHKANMASRRVKVESRRTSLEVARNRLKRIQEQVESARIYSEYDGFVFYPQQPHWRTDRNIEKGASVHPRQQILEFPDLSAWVIKTGVPESIIKRIEPGMKAYATIDALPDVVLEAKVDTISVVPDRKRWYDGDNKQYTVTLDVPAPPDQQLKPGMSVMVQIITEDLKDVVKVPLQAVTTRDGKHFVYRIDGNDIEPTEVKIGTHSETEIQIVGGIEPGQELLLYAPIDQESSPIMQDRPAEKADENGTANGGQDTEAKPKVEGKRSTKSGSESGEGRKRKRPNASTGDKANTGKQG